VRGFKILENLIKSNYTNTIPTSLPLNLIRKYKWFSDNGSWEVYLELLEKKGSSRLSSLLGLPDGRKAYI